MVKSMQQHEVRRGARCAVSTTVAKNKVGSVFGRPSFPRIEYPRICLHQYIIGLSNIVCL